MDTFDHEDPHTSYCCLLHGCAFGSPDRRCPVKAGAMSQDRLCSDCSSPAEMAQALRTVLEEQAFQDSFYSESRPRPSLSSLRSSLLEEEVVKGFVRRAQPDTVAPVEFGLYILVPNGKENFNFSIEAVAVAPDQFVPRIAGKNWEVSTMFPELMDALTKTQQVMSIEDICDVLEQHGFTGTR